MPIFDFCKGDVAVVEKNSTVLDAARKMREAHVGDVVVVSRENGVSRPVGILTDRDIVVGLIALEIAFDTVRVDDVMTPTLVTANRSLGVNDTIRLMENYGIQRIPVVDDDGGLVGIVSSADLLELLGREIMSISKLSARQKVKEQEIRL